jgi:hypothetical protein
VWCEAARLSAFPLSAKSPGGRQLAAACSARRHSTMLGDSRACCTLPWSSVNGVFYHLLHAREAGLKKPLTGVIFEQFCVTHVPSQDSHRFMPKLISQFKMEVPKRVATGRISPHREETESNAARGNFWGSLLQDLLSNLIRVG